MEKTIHSSAYALFLDLLKAQRESKGLTQLAIAAKLGATQTFVSKCERGERRLDVFELFLWCEALGISMAEFVQRFDDALHASSVAGYKKNSSDPLSKHE